MKEVFIITALPFRKQGNQSLMRFVKMFIDRDINVSLCTSGSDKRGENILKSDLFDYITFKTLGNIYSNIFPKKKESLNTGYGNIYSNINSENIMAPFGKENNKTAFLKWITFITTLIDNSLLFFNLIFFKYSKIRHADVIIAYGVNYSFVSKSLTLLFNKKFIIKNQGTILKTTDRNIFKCIKYYPLYYFGLLKADLAIMVNDGTDGDWYLRKRGNNNILFSPHGVEISDYDNIDLKKSNMDIILSKYENKFVISNLASGTTWKRVDRVIKFIKHLPEDVKNSLVVFTTYYGPGRKELIEMTKKFGLSKQVIFLEKLNHIESHVLLKRSHILLSTNDMSNLGNPVLEAVYYNIPVITIDDDTTRGIIFNNVNGILIKLDKKFDENLAAIVKNFINNTSSYNNTCESTKSITSVKTVKEQQEIEYDKIIKCYEDIK